MIKEFKGDHQFLSNFWLCPVKFEDQMYVSSEHAYMAAKTDDPEVRKQIADCATAAEAKRMGRSIKLRAGWNDMRVNVMYQILTDKFTRNLNLREKLLATGNEELIEGNWWNDTFWGVCLKTNQGQNWLGRVLMQVRLDLATS